MLDFRAYKNRRLLLWLILSAAILLSSFGRSFAIVDRAPIVTTSQKVELLWRRWKQIYAVETDEQLVQELSR